MANLDLFGWAFKRKKVAITDQPQVSFTPKQDDDGAVVIAAGGAYGTYVDLDGTVRTEAELINRYREMALHAEVYAAIDEITNEAISTEEEEVVKINLDNLQKPNDAKAIKDAIEECWEDTLKLLDFRNNSYKLFHRWYTDGRLYFHVIIDPNKPEEGIQELRYVDPRKIRKIREVIKKNVKGGDVTTGDAITTGVKNEYYIYNEKGFNTGAGRPVGPNVTGLKIAADAIVYVTSGLTDVNGTMVLSYLHKAIKPLNQLRTLEDANVIYCLSRAPERRVWYIDVGNLPKMKAEQYVRDIMVKHKNRLIYDAASGEIRDDRKFMTMLEDYWLPRREGGKGTEVTTLPAGQNLGEMANVEYFLRKLYGALHVPINRLNPDDVYIMGQDLSAGISRDEIKFGKFIGRMRNDFTKLFLKVLCKQMVLKQVMTIEDYEKISPDLRFDFSRDNYFLEQKENQVTLQRVDVVHQMMDLIGRYYSNEWVVKNILKQSDEEIEEMRQQITEEMNDPIWNPPLPEDGEEGEGEEGGNEQDQEVQPDPMAQQHLQAAKTTYDTLSPKKKNDGPDFKKASKAIARNG